MKLSSLSPKTKPYLRTIKQLHKTPAITTINLKQASQKFKASCANTTLKLGRPLAHLRQESRTLYSNSIQPFLSWSWVHRESPEVPLSRVTHLFNQNLTESEGRIARGCEFCCMSMQSEPGFSAEKFGCALAASAWVITVTGRFATLPLNW